MGHILPEKIQKQLEKKKRSQKQFKNNSNFKNNRKYYRTAHTSRKDSETIGKKVRNDLGIIQILKIIENTTGLHILPEKIQKQLEKSQKQFGNNSNFKNNRKDYRTAHTSRKDSEAIGKKSETIWE